MANAIVAGDHSGTDYQLKKWDQDAAPSSGKSVVIHAGSGRELDACIEYCSKTGSVLLELSTGLKTEYLNPDFALIVCPNTAVLVVRVVGLLKSLGNECNGYEIAITESHQSTKTSKPGTAYLMAEALHVPVQEVHSVRDPDVQRDSLGIPHQYLDKHAYHKIVIKNAQEKVTIETEVLGHDPYVSGVKKILEKILSRTFAKGRYNVLDLFC